MIAIGFGFLALFSVLSVLLGNEEPRHGRTLGTTFALWMRYGAAERTALAYPTRPRASSRGFVVFALRLRSPLPGGATRDSVERARRADAPRGT